MRSLGRLVSGLRGRADPRRQSPVGTEFFARPENFSLIVFTGDVTGAIPTWFRDLNYRELARRSLEGDFRVAYDSIRGIEGNNNIVSKAIYVIPGFTILLDPEMVLSVEESLPNFCSASNTRAIAVVWERVSESTLARTTSPTGEDQFVHWLKDECVQRTGDWPQPDERPGPEWLKALLQRAGVPTNLLFGRISATIFRLQE